MLYCESCKMIFAGDLCPECRRSGREPKDADPTLAGVIGYLEKVGTDIALRSRGIPYSAQSKLGNGFVQRAGFVMEEYRIYVPYQYLDEAIEALRLMRADELPQNGT